MDDHGDYDVLLGGFWLVSDIICKVVKVCYEKNLLPEGTEGTVTVKSTLD
jgi:hypothetical protein